MILKNGKFINAVFASSKKDLILAIWYDELSKQHHEIAITTDLHNKMYVKLLETFTTDEISTMTDQKRKHAAKSWELIVKDVAEKYGLIYDPTATNPQEKLVIDHLFNPPEGEAGMELLFNTKLKIFNFNTDWCGWSKRFQPEWDKFTQAVKADSKLNNKVEVFDVKCDNPANQQMCEEYNVPGYPYVIVEKNGNRSPYNGERTAQALISFVS